MRRFCKVFSGVAAAALLAGCATIRSGADFGAEAAAVQHEAVRLLVRQSHDSLHALVSALAVPATPQATTAAASSARQAAESLEAARAGLIGGAALAAGEPTMAGSAELAILGATLTICRQSLRKIDRRIDSDWADADRLARGELRYACLLPLAAFAAF